MMKLGRVSTKTMGTPVTQMVEDKILCRPGNTYHLQGSGCPGG